MISSNAKKFCRDDISLIKNYAEALADTKMKISAAMKRKRLSRVNDKSVNA